MAVKSWQCAHVLLSWLYMLVTVPCRCKIIGCLWRKNVHVMLHSLLGQPWPICVLSMLPASHLWPCFANSLVEWCQYMLTNSTPSVTYFYAWSWLPKLSDKPGFVVELFVRGDKTGVAFCVVLFCCLDFFELYAFLYVDFFFVNVS